MAKILRIMDAQRQVESVAQIPDSMTGWRLDRVVCGLFPGCSRADAKSAIEQGLVKVDDVVCKRARQQVASGRLLQLSGLPAAARSSCEVPALPELIHEDEQIAILDKPPGLTVHPGSGRSCGTLADALAAARPQLRSLPRAGLAHRLDKDTSGLLAVGKNPAALRALSRQFRLHTARRCYLAIVHGLPAATGVIDRALAGDARRRTRKQVAADGRRAVTRYAVIARGRDHALLRCYLETGRTHQIRAHLEHIGHPVAGDRVYARHARRAVSDRFGRQMLHAQLLELDHPLTGRRMKFASQPPEDFAQALRDLNIEC